MFLGGGDRLDVEELEDRRVHAEREQFDGRLERGLVGPERQQEGAAGSGQDGELERGLRDHAERALGTDPQVAEVEAADELAQRRGPTDFLTGRQEALEGVDVVADHAIFGRAQAAGIGGDVAADAAILDRGRVGREEETVGRGEVVDVRRDRPWLDGRHR